MNDDELREIERILSECRQAHEKLTGATTFRARVLIEMLIAELERSCAAKAKQRDGAAEHR